MGGKLRSLRNERFDRVEHIPHPHKVRALVVNLYSSQNAGDAAALEVTISQLRRVFPHLRLSLSMTDPAYHAEDEAVDVLSSFLGICRPWGEGRNPRPRWRLAAMSATLADTLWAALKFRLGRWTPQGILTSERGLIEAYLQADLVVSAAGMNFYTMGRLGLPLLTSLYTAAYALMLGKPLYIISQSIGPFYRSWERWLMRWLLSKAALVFVRDTASWRLLGDMGLAGPRYRLLPDIVFAFQGAPQEQGIHLLNQYGIDVKRDRPLLGCTVVNRFIRWIPQEVWDNYERSLIGAIRRFTERHGGKVIFFPQTTGPTRVEDDRESARRIVAKIQETTDGIVYIDQPQPAAVLKSAYGLTDLCLATRAHAAVFALASGVPALIVGYHWKARGIMETLGLDEWVLDIDSVNEDLLSAKLEALWKERHGVRSTLRRTIPDIVQRIEGLGPSIADDLFTRQARRGDRASP